MPVGMQFGPNQGQYAQAMAQSGAAQGRMENTERQAQLFSELRKIGAERQKLQQDVALGRTQEDAMRLGMELDQRAQHLQEELGRQNMQLQWQNQQNQMLGQMMGLAGQFAGGGGGGGGGGSSNTYKRYRGMGIGSSPYPGGNTNIGGGWSELLGSQDKANLGATLSQTRALNNMMSAILPQDKNGVIKGGMWNAIMVGPGGAGGGSMSRYGAGISMPKFEYRKIPQREEPVSPYAGWV